jgi:Ca2+-binding EF-hand superfamily protein
MINLVDTDGSGQVEFDEFLDIMRSSQDDSLHTKEMA